MPQIDCKKCDIFNFVHDFYDGQNLGAICIALLNKKSSKKQRVIRNVFKKYIDVKVIDKANSVNRQKLDLIWGIKNIQYLENTVLTPDQYLKNKTFSKYQV